MRNGMRWALVIACAPLLVACQPPEQAKDPPLVADPPQTGAASNADDGAVQTELERGIAYVKNEKYAEAKEHFKKAIAVKPSAAAWTYLGIAAEKTGDKPGAVDAYKSALGVDPGFVEAAENLAAIYLDDPPKPDEAIGILKPAIAKTPDPRLYQNLAYAYGLKGQIDEAGKAYEAALAKGDDPQVRFAYGSLLLDNKQPERAAEQLKKALDGAKDPALIATLGAKLGAVHAFGDCVRAYDKVIAQKADVAEWYVSRGLCKHELKDDDGAHKDYEAGVQANPNHAAAHYYLAWSYLVFQKKRYAAISHMEKAMKLGEGTRIGKLAADKFKELTKQKK